MRVARLVALALASTQVVTVACARAPVPAIVPTAAVVDASLLAGTWVLVAADDEGPDGTRVPAYGPAPAGRLMIDREGRYSLQIFRGERPPFASGDKKAGTPDEYRDALLTLSTHLGRCAIAADGRTLVFHIEQAAYPNWRGLTQERTFTLARDHLIYRQPAAAGAAVPLTEWRRIGR